MFLFWFNLIGSGDHKPFPCDMVDVCVIGRGTEGEVDHGVETLSVCGGEKEVKIGHRKWIILGKALRF